MAPGISRPPSGSSRALILRTSAAKESASPANFEQVAELGAYERFTFPGICAPRGEGRYDEIYAHAKVMVVDDAWATVGSTNIASQSFRHDTEMNASFWHEGAARALREALFEGFLGGEAARLPELDAFDRLAEIAGANLDRRALWQDTEGFLYALDPAQYGA
jgi:phosphatidylserine/phosphatidylglycerophosphate/cardiolipin synthase-like enzyme